VGNGRAASALTFHRKKRKLNDATSVYENTEMRDEQNNKARILELE